MSERKDSTQPEYLPIKLVMPKQAAVGRIKASGSAPVPFRVVDDAYKQSLVRQVEGLSAVVGKLGIAPVRLQLLNRASAKSHRPTSLFDSDSCPIIGAGRLGELFIKATPNGLTKLISTINTSRSALIEKELSCVEKIEPITAAYRRKGIEAIEILRSSPRGDVGFILRARLFNFGQDAEGQTILTDNFIRVCSERDIRISQDGYSEMSFTYELECRTVDDIDALAQIVGIRSITKMPRIHNIRARAVNITALPDLPSRVDADVPVVAVVDSGVTSKVPPLESWVMEHDSAVAPEYQNTDHGSFVSGLICWAEKLNPIMKSLGNDPCGIYDIQVIPNDDPDRGPVGSLLESEFLCSLEIALKKYSNKCKVWNLSLGTDVVCSLDEFSPLAEELDNLQEKYQVSFVISAGNYTTLPLLSFPRVGSQLENGRITPPADSVLGITVGAISHISYQANGPKENEPSSFSRHGPGPNFIIKPDLVHFGGSCSTDASHISGIRSINAEGSAEDLGTSFSAPLVSRTLAQIYHQITPTPSPVLAKALLIHHARDPRTEGRVPDGDEAFLGFGMPKPVPYCLACTPFSSTLIFDDELRPGFFLEWDDFPYPPSLYRDGRYYGEIWMTVAFAPSRGARWGVEYCETHIDAHLGVYHEQKKRATGEIVTKFSGLVPPEHKNVDELYEQDQVEKLRKWAPVRTYYRSLGEKGVPGKRWRLKLQLLCRHGIDKEDAFRPQPFSLIITISDPTRSVRVYDEMAQVVRNRFQAQNLNLRNTVRVQARSGAMP